MRRTIVVMCVLGVVLGLGGGRLAVTAVAQKTTQPADLSVSRERQAHQEYMDFFVEVYQKMQQHYYHPVDITNFKKFVYIFEKKIYPELRNSRKSKDYIKWRSAAYLVDFLKASDDIFSAFMPPKAAEDFEKKVLGKRIDLGIEGEPVPAGYRVTFVEPRSDAFDKGLRQSDVLLRIGEEELAGMAEDAIQQLLMPLEGTEVVLHYREAETAAEKSITVLSKEYFKQLLFEVPVDVPGVYALRLERFNRKTGEDMNRLLERILPEDPRGLIIDLRGNPGGPPLAAREISAFFLPPKEEFAYFQRKGRPPARLYVPEISPEHRYHGDMVILVNEKSGSASELFSGVMQRRGRATVMGVNTAGQVFLKSMYYFDDQSMLLLVTARGHHPDGAIFSYDGVTPNEQVTLEDDDMIRYAAEYLLAAQDNTDDDGVSTGNKAGKSIAK